MLEVVSETEPLQTSWRSASKLRGSVPLWIYACRPVSSMASVSSFSSTSAGVSRRIKTSSRSMTQSGSSSEICFQVSPLHQRTVTWMLCEERTLAAQGFETLLLAHPVEGSLSFLIFGGKHDPEGLAVASHEPVELMAQGERIELVGLHALVTLVPDLGLLHVVGHAHPRRIAARVVAKRPRLTGTSVPALRAAFQAVNLTPLCS